MGQRKVRPSSCRAGIRTSRDMEEAFRLASTFLPTPKVLRSEGRVQFIIYRPEHMGHIALQMFAAFRQWAVEEGLDGMDIFETR